MDPKKWILVFGWLLIGSLPPAFARECFSTQPLENRTLYVLVLDQSGSMWGNRGIKNAKKAIHQFLAQLSGNEEVGLVLFSDEVDVGHEITKDFSAVKKAVDAVDPHGNTALYDGIAKAIQMTAGRRGQKTIIYLTDGRDNRSQYNPAELRKMLGTEGVLVYGIGLGDVDLSGLQKISRATRGSFLYAKDSNQLESIYKKVVHTYQQEYVQTLAQKGQLDISSFPDTRPIRINGKDVGQVTPHSMRKVPPGDYVVEVPFAQGVWRCNLKVKPDEVTKLEAREGEAGVTLSVSAQEVGSAIFIDGVYAGMTAYAKSGPDHKGWAAQLQKDPRQVHFNGLPKGKHRLKVRAMPDFKLGPEMEIDLEIEVGSEPLAFYVEVVKRRVHDSRGRSQQLDRPNKELFEKKKTFDLDGDPFKEFETFDKGF